MVCQESDPQDETLFATIRGLLAAEHHQRAKIRRAGLHDELWDILMRGAFRNSDEASDFAEERDKRKRNTQANPSTVATVQIHAPEEFDPDAN